MDWHDALSGEGTIRDTFPISGIGFVVVLEEEFSGRVAIGFTLESPTGRATIKAVEFVDVRDETRGMIGYTGLIVDQSTAPLFTKGQPVKFYQTAH